MFGFSQTALSSHNSYAATFELPFKTYSLNSTIEVLTTKYVLNAKSANDAFTMMSSFVLIQEVYKVKVAFWLQFSINLITRKRYE